LFEGPAQPDTLVLGCTHFPVLAEAIRRTVGSDVALVDSALTTAEAVAEALTARGLASAPGPEDAGTVRFFATDSPERFARVGAIFLNRAIDPATVELVDLRAL
jgi:glutamate racemase